MDAEPASHAQERGEARPRRPPLATPAPDSHRIATLLRGGKVGNRLHRITAQCSAEVAQVLRSRAAPRCRRGRRKQRADGVFRERGSTRRRGPGERTGAVAPPLIDSDPRRGARSDRRTTRSDGTSRNVFRQIVAHMMATDHRPRLLSASSVLSRTSSTELRAARVPADHRLHDGAPLRRRGGDVPRGGDVLPPRRAQAAPHEPGPHDRG